MKKLKNAALRYHYVLLTIIHVTNKNNSLKRNKKRTLLEPFKKDQDLFIGYVRTKEYNMKTTHAPYTRTESGPEYLKTTLLAGYQFVIFATEVNFVRVRR